MSDTKRPDLEFPDGDGKPDCPKCLGRGVVTVMIDMPGGIKWPGGTNPCDCVYERDLRANVKRIWPVLLNVQSVEKSPLLSRVGRSVWVTATNYEFRRHLRYVAFRQKPSWNARVFADSALVTAWLSTTKEAFDPDVLLDRSRTPSNEFFTIVDLAVPYDLLIIYLGVKAAKNREMPNVLMETINERDIAGKPTWVVDSPNKPLGPGHICYNESVMELLDGFERVVLSTEVTNHGGFQQMGLQPSGVVSRGSGGGTPYTKRKPGMVAPAPKPSPAPQTAPVPSQPAPAPVAAPIPVAASPQVQRPAPAPVSPVSRYAKRKPGLVAAVAAAPAPQSAPPPAPVVEYDEDDMSVDALIAGAVDPREDGVREGLLPPEESLDDILNYQPTAEELGTSHVPSFLRKAKAKMERGEKLRVEAEADLEALKNHGGDL